VKSKRLVGVRRSVKTSSSFLLCLLFSAAVWQADADATVIFANSGRDHCTVEYAIIAHNQKTPFPERDGCKAGDGNDVIKVEAPVVTIDPFMLPPGTQTIKNGSLEIVAANDTGCTELKGWAYFTILPGAALTLRGIGIEVNGNESRSVIDNDGGTLEIAPGRNCVPSFSNMDGAGMRPNTGGILFNRDGGKSRIDGVRFENSAATSLGGAIFIDSGTVIIDQALSFETSILRNNNAAEGGAIYVNRGASLRIASNNFILANNRAVTGRGGAIYNNGGTVSIERADILPSPSLENVALTSNSARFGSGGAVFSDAGTLRVDGIEIAGNSAGNGGGVALANIRAESPATIIRTRFDGNSSQSNGGAVYLGAASFLNVSQGTFEHNLATGQGGGIYVDSFGELHVDNSTFVGLTASNLEGIVVAAGGIGEIAFSTFYGALFGVGLETINLRDSILQKVTCQPGSVFDESGNLKFESTGCPASVPVTDPDLDPFLLSNHGGPTPTIALLPGSPAINRIMPANCVDSFGAPNRIDQRGYKRPAPRSANCDVGAFEFASSPAPLPGRRPGRR